MSKKKVATRGWVEDPYPARSGGQVFKVTWWDGEGPATVTDVNGVLTPGAQVRLVNGAITAQDGGVVS